MSASPYLPIGKKSIEQARLLLLRGPTTTAEAARELGLCVRNTQRALRLAGSHHVRAAYGAHTVYHYHPDQEARALAQIQATEAQTLTGRRVEALRGWLAVGPLSGAMVARVATLGAPISSAEAATLGARVADVAHIPLRHSAHWVVYANAEHGPEGEWLVERDLQPLHEQGKGSPGRRVGLLARLVERGQEGDTFARLAPLCKGQRSSLVHHLGALRRAGAVSYTPRPQGRSVAHPGLYAITQEGLRVLAAHHEEVLVGLRDGEAPVAPIAGQRVTAWGKLYDRAAAYLQDHRHASPAKFAAHLGIHPDVAAHLLPHVLRRLPTLADPLAERPRALRLGRVFVNRSPLQREAAKILTQIVAKEPNHDLAAPPANPAAQDGDDLLQQHPHQPAHPCASAEAHGDPDLGATDAPAPVGGEAAGGPACGDGGPAAREAGELGAPSIPGREPASADPGACGVADGASRGSGPDPACGGQPRQSGQGAGGPGSQPPRPLIPSPLSRPPLPASPPHRHVHQQEMIPTRGADLGALRRIAASQRAAAERASVVVEAGALRWTLRPVTAVTGAWEIVESTSDADKRIFGEDTAKRRLARLAAQGKLPARTDGLEPPSRQEAHP